MEGHSTRPNKSSYPLKPILFLFKLKFDNSILFYIVVKPKICSVFCLKQTNVFNKLK